MTARVLPLPVFALLLVTPLLAAQTTPSDRPAIDPRLAQATHALITPVDALDVDQPISACVAERLRTMTPLAAVTAPSDADLIIRVSGHVASDADRAFAALDRDRALSGLPPNPNRPPIDLRTTSTISAELPDGTVLWHDSYLHGTDHGDGVACRIAHDLLTLLREAMKAARDGR